MGIIILLYVVPALICSWRLYEKVGMDGWKALVPIYNYVVMAEIAKKPVWMGVIAGVSMVLYPYLNKSADTKSIGALLSLSALVFGIILLANYFKQYTLTLGQIIIILFLPIIAVFTLKNVQYKGGVMASTQPVNGQPSAQQQFPQSQAYAAPQAYGGPTTTPVTLQSPQNIPQQQQCAQPVAPQQGG